MTIDDEGKRVQNALKFDDVIYGRTMGREGRRKMTWPPNKIPGSATGNS
jgi:hypothetical protein